MNESVEFNQEDFDEQYKEACKRIRSMDHGLNNKSLEWVLSEEWALTAYNHPHRKMFNKTVYDWCMQMLHQEQQATRVPVIYETEKPVNPYYPNNSNRAGD